MDDLAERVLPAVIQISVSGFGRPASEAAVKTSLSGNVGLGRE
jgi:hypothetical protein